MPVDHPAPPAAAAPVAHLRKIAFATGAGIMAFLLYLATRALG